MLALRTAVLIPALVCLAAVSRPPVDRDPDSPEVRVAARAALASARILNLSGTILEIQTADLGIDGVLKDLGATVTPQQIRFELSADVLFDSDKITLRPQASETLRKVAQVVSGTPNAPLLIEAHTDNKGAHPSNMKLSENRAAALKQWVIANTGIKPPLVRTAGWGDTRPVAPNAHPDGSDNPQGRQSNRRLEVTLQIR